MCKLFVHIWRSRMDKNEKYPPINVLNVIRGFPTSKIPLHITPFRFELHNGDKYDIKLSVKPTKNGLEKPFTTTMWF